MQLSRKNWMLSICCTGSRAGIHRRCWFWMMSNWKRCLTIRIINDNCKDRNPKEEHRLDNVFIVSESRADRMAHDICCRAQGCGFCRVFAIRPDREADNMGGSGFCLAACNPEYRLEVL